MGGEAPKRIAIPENAKFEQFDGSVFCEILKDMIEDVSPFKAGISILDLESNKEFWRLNFNVTNTKRRLIPDDCWLLREMRWQPCIELDEYFENQSWERCTTTLRKHFDWPMQSRVVFFGGADVILTTWQIFSEIWNGFWIANNEGFLMPLAEEGGLLFSPKNCILEGYAL